MEWSKYQLEVYKQGNESKNDLLIQAVAGSGKSSTIVELSRRLKGRNLFLAFNKSIVEELKTKVAYGTDVSTLHSLGCKALFSKYGKLKINEFKTGKFIGSQLKKWEVAPNKIAMAFASVSKLVDIYRLTMCKNKQDLQQSADQCGVEYYVEHLDWTLDTLKLLQRYNNNPQEIDFTDMLYLPATNNNLFLPKYDNIFIDECQDLSNVQHTLVDKLTINSRAIFVGDRYQSIYGFAGANTESFDRILKRPNIIELPLSICYRCPTRVIDHANKIYPIVEPAPGAKSGEVRVGDLQEAASGDMIICRNLKPLLEAYFKLLAQRKKVYIKGIDIGKNLIQLIKQHEADNITTKELTTLLNQDLIDLIVELKSRGIDKPTRHPSYQALSEKISAIKIISSEYSNVSEMIRSLNTIFQGDMKDAIVLSTIHKAKGLEANTVFFLDDHLLGQRVNTKQQKQQEKNLEYVAITRAKQKLIYTYS